MCFFRRRDCHSEGQTSSASESGGRNGGRIMQPDVLYIRYEKFLGSFHTSSTTRPAVSFAGIVGSRKWLELQRSSRLSRLWGLRRFWGTQKIENALGVPPHLDLEEVVWRVQIADRCVHAGCGCQPWRYTW